MAPKEASTNPTPARLIFSGPHLIGAFASRGRARVYTLCCSAHPSDGGQSLPDRAVRASLGGLRSPLLAEGCIAPYGTSRRGRGHRADRRSCAPSPCEVSDCWLAVWYSGRPAYRSKGGDTHSPIEGTKANLAWLKLGYPSPLVQAMQKWSSVPQRAAETAT